MKKITFKNIYLLLVISVGLISLGFGSTFAMFTANAKIDNPISLKSNLSYKDDIFESFDISIDANSLKIIQFVLNNDNSIDNLKYASWYIYDGNDSDIGFLLTSDDINVNGSLPTDGGTISLRVTNRTSSTIKLTMGVSVTNDVIILPSYMKLIPSDSTNTHNLTINKGTGVSSIYYKVNDSSNYVASLDNVSTSVEEGTVYYYYGIPEDGYTMSSCTLSSPCSGTMGDSDVVKSLSADAINYTLT